MPKILNVSTAVSFPPPLKPKGTVGIVSPGRWPERAWIDKTKSFLEKKGYSVVVHAQNYLKEGQLAGSDAARVEAVMDMFTDVTIDAILCARGGTGAVRLLDKLDYKMIQKNPKPFIGFSDITVLLQAITRRCGFVTYHGPMGFNFGQVHNDPRTNADFLAVIGNKKKTMKMNFPDVKTERAGKTEGILVGGNICLLQYMIGTPYDWSGKDAILFMEDVDEPLYKIDNRLAQFRLAGKFKDVRAVLVGEMIDISDGESGSRKGGNPYGRSLKQIILEHVPPEVPLAFNFPCGHGRYTTTLPVGALVNLGFSARGAELSFTITTNT